MKTIWFHGLKMPSNGTIGDYCGLLVQSECLGTSTWIGQVSRIRVRIPCVSFSQLTSIFSDTSIELLVPNAPFFEPTNSCQPFRFKGFKDKDGKSISSLSYMHAVESIRRYQSLSSARCRRLDGRLSWASTAMSPVIVCLKEVYLSQPCGRKRTVLAPVIDDLDDQKAYWKPSVPVIWCAT